MGLLNSLFGSKKKSHQEEKLDNHNIASSLFAYIINDNKLALPVYLDSIKSEEDANSLGFYPFIYIWNENRSAGSFTVSVNANAIGLLLEETVPREHSQFTAIRDEVMLVLLKTSQETVISICEEQGAPPSIIFNSQ